ARRASRCARRVASALGNPAHGNAESSRVVSRAMHPVAQSQLAWIAPEPLSAPSAFATLDRADQRMLEAVLFDGWSCAHLAGSIGISACESRQQIGAAMRELHALTRGDDGEPGAVGAMLALRALDALDPDEAAVIDAMLEQQPALLATYAGYCDL